MSLRLVYGRSGTGKTSFCFKEIGENINNNKIYIITPEQFSFTAEQNLMNAVNSKAVINAEVLTFERMAYRVINEIGNTVQTSLSECGKAMLLYSILDEQKNNLKYLGKTEKNLDVILRTITELKKHNVNTEMIEDVLKDSTDVRLKYKLEDIQLLYKSYNELINNKYIDENDILTILNENIEKVDMFKNTIIYIDEFAGFTKQEYLLIEKLLKMAKKLTISICTDNLLENTNPDIDIFYPNKIAANRIKELAKKNNVLIEEDVILEKRYRYKNRELYKLEDSLATSKKDKYEENVENIKMFLASNPYSEVEYMANNIIELVRDKNYQYRDIAIITKDITKYSGLIKAIFGKYEIPVFIDEKQDLSQNILVNT